MPKITQKDITCVDRLLKTMSPEDIINNHPDRHRELMHILFRTHSCAAIASLFTNCGIKISRQYVHKILQENPHLVIKQSNEHRYPSKPTSSEVEAKVIQMYSVDGYTVQEIAKALKIGLKRIKEIVETHNITRMPKRVVKIGDRFGNWEVIGYVPQGRSLCRDVRNGVEKVVKDQALLLGTSTGCRELAIVGRGAAKAKEKKA